MKTLFYLIVPGFFTVCLFLLIAFSCLSPDCWHDEIVTLGESCGSYENLLYQLRTLDVYPPLYYSIIHVISRILNIDCASHHFAFMIPVMKALSIIFIGTFMWFAVKFISATKGKIAGITCILICFANPMFLNYVVEIRPYTLSAIFTATGFIAGIRALQSANVRWWGLYSLCAACSAYTHYYALLTIALISIFFFIYCWIKERAHISALILANVVAAIAFLPWLPSLLAQLHKVQNSWWCTESLRQSYQYILNICGTTIGDSFIPWFSILLVVGTFALCKAYKSKDYQSLLVILAGYLIVPAIWGVTIVNSLLNNQQIIQQRYLFFGILVFAVGIAWAAAHLPRKWHALFNIFLLIVACSSVLSYFRQEYRSWKTFSRMQHILAEKAPAYVYYTPKAKDLHLNKQAIYALPAKNVTPVCASGISLKDCTIWSDIYNKLYSNPHICLADLPDKCTIILTEQTMPQFIEETKNIKLNYTLQPDSGYNILTVERN